MSKLMIALIASTFAGAVAAQTGTVSPATVADHGTPVMHAAETAKTVAASKGAKGLSSTAERQQALKEATRVADHGTPVLHAEEARLNVAASIGQPKPLVTVEAGQEAVKSAGKGATK